MMLAVHARRRTAAAEIGTSSTKATPEEPTWSARVAWSMVTTTVVASPPWIGSRFGSRCSSNETNAVPSFIS